MLDLTLGWLSVGLQFGVLAGLTVRGRWRRLLALPILLLAVSVTAVVTLLWPERKTWEFWLIGEFVHAGLLLLMGLELALLLFLRVPEARRSARWWIVAVIVGMVAVILLVPARPLMTTLLPWLMLALVWLYGGVLYVCLEHVVPIDPLHKTVLLGFTAYMLVYALSWGFTATDTHFAGVINAVAFNVLMMALLSAAWRNEAPLGELRRTADHFWPWRRRESGRARVDSARRPATVAEWPGITALPEKKRAAPVFMGTARAAE